MEHLNEKEELKDKIKRLRKQNGLSQRDVASVAGMQQSSIASIEKGETASMYLKHAVGIAKALKVGFNELYDIDGDTSKVEKVQNANASLKSRIVELEEQLNDKRSIIEFLSNSNFLLKEVAWILKQRQYKLENPREPFDFSDGSLINYDLDREKFMKDEAEEFLKRFVEEGKIHPKGNNEVS